MHVAFPYLLQATSVRRFKLCESVLILYLWCGAQNWNLTLTCSRTLCCLMNRMYVIGMSQCVCCHQYRTHKLPLRLILFTRRKVHGGNCRFQEVSWLKMRAHSSNDQFLTEASTLTTNVPIPSSSSTGPQHKRLPLKLSFLSHITAMMNPANPFRVRSSACSL